MKFTPFYKFHKKFGHIGEFAGFLMPIFYKGPQKEHLCVRNNVGIFDISHMGRLLVKGPQSIQLLNFLLTNDCNSLKVMKGRLAFFCNEVGGIIDDVMVFRLEKYQFLIIVNAINKDKDLNWIRKNVGSLDVEIEDLTEKVPMVAVQGPKASWVLQKVFGSGIPSIARLEGNWFSTFKSKVYVSRTGYTGEDGFEIFLFDAVDEEKASDFWGRIIDVGEEFEIEACGLAARDTLRLEAGFCLYDNELNEEISPIEAKLEFGLKFNQRSFVGKDALMKQMRQGVDRTRVGLKLIERGIPRKGMRIWMQDEEIGFVTSGNISPILRTGIALGRISSKYDTLGTIVDIEIRGKRAKAEMVNFPFYDADRYGFKRKI